MNGLKRSSQSHRKCQTIFFPTHQLTRRGQCRNLVGVPGYRPPKIIIRRLVTDSATTFPKAHLKEKLEEEINKKIASCHADSRYFGSTAKVVPQNFHDKLFVNCLNFIKLTNTCSVFKKNGHCWKSSLPNAVKMSSMKKFEEPEYDKNSESFAKKNCFLAFYVANFSKAIGLTMFNW